jgi:hypothetical protein
MSVVDGGLCCFIGVSRHKVHGEFREVSSRKDSELGVSEMVAPQDPVFKSKKTKGRKARKWMAMNICLNPVRTGLWRGVGHELPCGIVDQAPLRNSRAFSGKPLGAKFKCLASG